MSVCLVNKKINAAFHYCKSHSCQIDTYYTDWYGEYILQLLEDIILFKSKMIMKQKRIPWNGQTVTWRETKLNECVQNCHNINNVWHL